MWEAVILAVGAGVGLLIEYRHNHWRLKAWQNAASVQLKDVGEKNKHARIHVSFHGPKGFKSVAIRPRPEGLVSQGREVGDTPFDTAFSLKGRRSVAAADALGRIGSVGAVLPLKEAAESSWFDRDFRRAARQAVAEIQSRLQGALPGQLSLAGTEAGQLSLAQAETGQLSLAKDPAGQLSLGDDGVD